MWLRIEFKGLCSGVDLFLVDYDAVSMPKLFEARQSPHFQGSIGPSKFFQDLSTLEDKDTILPRKVKIRLPSEAT